MTDYANIFFYVDFISADSLLVLKRKKNKNKKSNKILCVAQAEYAIHE